MPLTLLTTLACLLAVPGENQPSLQAEVKIIGNNFYKKGQTPEDLEKMNALANTVIDVSGAPDELTVDDAFSLLFEQLDNKGWEIVITFDTTAIFEDPDDSSTFHKAKLKGIASRKQMSTQELLGEIVKHSPNKKTTFVIRPHFITFTTTDRAMSVPMWTRWGPGEIK
jgi:hypothetical protein